MTLATSDGENPWASPLYYCTDEELNFYFISQLDSLHSKNILQNPNVSFAIFDSHQIEGTGNGVQAKGAAGLIEENKIDEALKWYKTTFIEMKKETFIGEAPYRLFKITPSNLYILDPDTDVDARIEILI